MLQFARILWVKSVTLDEDTFAYGGEDPGVRATEPRRPGDTFALHCTPEDAESLADPAPGDLLVLTQHALATHLVRVVADTVETRPKRTIRPGTRDARFSRQRTCALVYLRRFDDAPTLEETFGVAVDVFGGEVLRISELPGIVQSGLPMWAVQRRAAKALAPDRFAGSVPTPQDGPMRRVDPGPGRVRRGPK